MASNMTHDMQIRVSKVTYFLKYHIIWGNYSLERKDTLMYSSCKSVAKYRFFPGFFVICPIVGKKKVWKILAKDEKLLTTDGLRNSMYLTSTKNDLNKIT